LTPSGRKVGVMKMSNMRLVECNRAIYIVELNKRGCYRQKKEVTHDFKRLLVNKLSESVISLDDDMYLVSIRKMDKEQKVMLKASKRKFRSGDIESWMSITGGFIGSLFGESLSQLKKMYRN